MHGTERSRAALQALARTGGAPESFGERMRIAGRDQDACVGKGLAIAADIGSDDGKAGGHAFKDGVGEAFGVGTEDGDIHGSEPGTDVELSSGESDGVCEAEGVDLLFDHGTLIAFTDDDETQRGTVAKDDGGCFEEYIEALNGAETGEIADKKLIFSEVELMADGFAQGAGGAHRIEVDAVVNGDEFSGGDAFETLDVGGDGLGIDLDFVEQAVAEAKQELFGNAQGTIEEVEVAAHANHDGDASEFAENGANEARVGEDGQEEMEALGAHPADKVCNLLHAAQGFDVLDVVMADGAAGEFSGEPASFAEDADLGSGSAAAGERDQLQ